MQKIIILKGLPASGKSTYAKTLIAKGNWVRLNKDDARLQYFNSNWSPEREKFIIKLRNSALYSALDSGYNVVVDDTNFSPEHEIEIKKIAQKFNNVYVEVKLIDTPLDICLERNRARTNPVPDKFILDTYNKYFKSTASSKTVTKENSKVEYTPPKNKPNCIIVDIDGTLAHMTTRKGYPYAWHRVKEDSVDQTVADIVRKYAQRNVNDEDYTRIIIVSGRDEVCKNETKEWLNDNNIPFDFLFMRPAGDNRKDTIIKKEIFDLYIKNQYRVLFILDDRNSVVKMWREEVGVKVLQVEEGNF